MKILKLLILLLVPLGLFAQSGSDTLQKKVKRKKLKNVKVRVRSSGNKIDNLNAIRTERLGEKELQKNACCNISESFESNASVDVALGDGLTGSRQVQMLGLSGRYVQTLSDLLPSVRGLNYTYGFNNLPGTFVEQIYINKGPGSVVNSFEAMTGQIDLELIKPERYKNTLFVNGYANTNQRLELNVNSAVQLTERWSTLLATHVSNANKSIDQNADGFLDIPKSSMLHLMNRWKYQGEKLTTNFGVKYHQANRMAGEVGFDQQKEPDEQVFVYGIGLKEERIEAFAKIGTSLNEEGDKSIGFQFSGSVHNKDNFYGHRDYDGKQYSGYANMIVQSPIANRDEHLIKTGLSVMADDIDENYDGLLFERKEAVTGAFAEYSYLGEDNITLLAGVRADYNWRLDKAFISPRLNIKYEFTDDFSARFSAGSGFRTANIFAENSRLFTSNREVKILDVLDAEQSWNYGLNLSYCYLQNTKQGRLSFDIFRTDFVNQVIADYDASPQEVQFYNLDGQSYAWYVQAEWYYELFKNFDLRLAYKWNEVKLTQRGQLVDRVFTPKHRALANLAYETNNEKWMFDFTTQWVGEQRLPDFSANPLAYQPSVGTFAPSFFKLLGQVTYKANEDLEFYVGSENITNYTQQDLVIGADAPFGQYFDAGAIWGPTIGRLAYGGFRYKIAREKNDNEAISSRYTPLFYKSNPIDANLATDVVDVNGACGMCKENIENALKGFVQSADWNRATHKLTVRYNPETINMTEILKKVALAGYDNQMFTAPNKIYESLPACCQYRNP